MSLKLESFLHGTPQSSAILEKLTDLPASQQILCILQNLKVLYCIHNRQLPVPVLNHINPVHVPYPTSWRSILIQSSHLPSECFPSGLPIRILYGPPLYPTRTPYLTHLILIDLIIRIMFAEKCSSCRS